MRCLWLVWLAGCSPATFDVGAPLRGDAAPTEVAAGEVSDVASPDGACVVPDGSGWCAVVVGGCEFDAATKGCTARPGWLNAVPLCGATGFAVTSCVANPDGSGDGSPCVAATIARVQSCGVGK